MAALAAFVVAYATFSQVRFGTGKPAPVTKKDPHGNVTSTHTWAVTAVFAVGCAGLMMMIAEYGGRIPAFSAHADDFRTNLSSGLPQLCYFQLVVAALIAYALSVHAVANRRRTYLRLICVASLGLIFMGASRSMFLTPIMIMLLDLWRRGRIRTGRLILGGLTCGLILFAVGLLRMDTELEQGVYLLRFAADFAPEFREFAKLLEIMPDGAPFLHGQMFANAALIVLPGKVLGLVGLSKAEYWLPFGEYLKDLFNYQFAGGGLRAGLIAEFYANFGFPGILVGFYGLGLTVRLVESGVHAAGAVRRLFYLAVGLSVASSLLFTFDAVIYKLVAFAIGWGLYGALAGCLGILAGANHETQAQLVTDSDRDAV